MVDRRHCPPTVAGYEPAITHAGILLFRMPHAFPIQESWNLPPPAPLRRKGGLDNAQIVPPLRFDFMGLYPTYLP